MTGRPTTSPSTPMLEGGPLELLEALQAGVILHHADGTVQACNPSAERILGLPAREIVGRGYGELPLALIREDGTPYPLEEHPVTTALRSGQARLHVAMGLRKPDGTVSWVAVNAQPLFHPGAERPYAAVESLIDLSRRKRIEETLRQRELGIRSLYEITTSPRSSLTDRTHTLLAMGCQLFRMPVGVLGRIEGDRFLLVDALAPPDRLRRERTLPLGETLAEPTALADGALAFEDADASPWAGHPSLAALGIAAYLGSAVRVEGRVIGTLGFWSPSPRREALSESDRELLEMMTRWLGSEMEQEKARETLWRAKEAAETANLAKSQFLANMSHELRTPLNSVIGFANILMKNKGQNLESQQLQYLERIQENGTHLLTLINDILDLSKIEAGRVDLELQPVALGPLVRETLQQLGSQLPSPRVRLLADEPGDLQPALTDPKRLKQVLINLVGNALKFTERGSITVRIVPDGEGRPVRVDVVDTGVGIPPERQQAVFEAFQQADNSTQRRFGGTGLGLTISRSLLQAMGYSLTLESEVGKGSTFRIHLTTGEAAPSARPAGAPRPVRPPRPSVMAGERPPRILLIDDDADSRILLGQYLEDLGCVVTPAASGAEGLRSARAHPPDLITLDLLMPETDGWEVLRLLKDDPMLAQIPVVVLSIIAVESRSDLRGADAVLNKPVDRQALEQVLTRLFATR